MKRVSKRLEIVKRLAELKQQRAAETLGRAITDAQAQQQQKAMLEEYQSDYSNRFVSQGAEGINGYGLLNYRQFFTNLNNANEAQKERISFSEQQLAYRRQEWQAAYGKQVTLEGLIDRKKLAEDIEEDKKQQAELDDRFNNLNLYKKKQ